LIEENESFHFSNADEAAVPFSQKLDIQNHHNEILSSNSEMEIPMTPTQLLSMLSSGTDINVMVKPAETSPMISHEELTAPSINLNPMPMAQENRASAPNIIIINNNVDRELRPIIKREVN
jgi:hypothetical protein